ncbi:hypothetical protein [Pseudocnuella soli]|uniref:hypothetical protein n=1 Tax=Pseudocnuella soli TaxID=2502779 RepID=UPI0010525882|nr:hypothetical protein [Pseudocnuella soli]
MRSKLLAGLLCILFAVNGQAQPYLDVASIRFHKSPDAGLVRRNFNRNSFEYGQAQVQLPLVSRDSSIILLNPIAEQWSISSTALASAPQWLRGLAMVGGYIKPWSPQWTTTTLLVARWNGAGDFGFNNRFQLGTVLLATRTVNPKLKYKFGLYYNREFFGNFFIPLAGIEWTINPRLQLFGTLPGSLVLERKVSSRLYYGASFRAITTSFRYRAGAEDRFVRIDDNQVQAFTDLYLQPKLVLTAELGHSLFRRFRLGATDGFSKYFFAEKFNDGVHFRLSLAYRLRFDEAATR